MPNLLPDAATSRLSSTARAEVSGQSEFDNAAAHLLSPRRLASHSAWYALVPAVFLCFLGVAASQDTMPQPLSTEQRVSVSEPGERTAESVVIPASQTFVVQSPASVKAVVLRARLQVAPGVTGRAPVSGQITRIWAREGQVVNVGDRVLRIAASSTVLSTPMPDLSSSDKAAEAEQTAAAKQQQQLQLKMDDAQKRLQAAQKRVDLARERIARTRTIVQKLQSGTEVEYSNEEETAPEVAPRQAAPVTGSERCGGIGHLFCCVESSSNCRT
jgi:multidrug efflux pump subunit AcrA (membrane-fusion protein)